MFLLVGAVLTLLLTGGTSYNYIYKGLPTAIKAKIVALFGVVYSVIIGSIIAAIIAYKTAKMMFYIPIVLVFIVLSVFVYRNENPLLFSLTPDGSLMRSVYVTMMVGYDPIIQSLVKPLN